MHIKQVTLPSRSKALVRMTDGSVAELPGELGLHGFLANAKDVKWIEPEDRRDRPVNDAEMKLIAEAIEENTGSYSTITTLTRTGASPPPASMSRCAEICIMWISAVMGEPCASMGSGISADSQRKCRARTGCRRIKTNH